MSASSKTFDVVVWGATGFTGSLVAEYYLSTYGASPSGFKWALAGRSEDKLKALKDRLSSEIDTAASSIPTITADSNDEESLDRLASQTKVVVTTVGPFAIYGDKLVAACVAAGTHYCDLTGESLWVKDIIEKYQKEAERTGAKIIPSCGFDSVPADMGAFMMVEHMKRVHGRSPNAVKYYLRDMKGGVSGGTIASVMDVSDKLWKGGKSTMKQMNDPLLLSPLADTPTASERRPVGGFGYDSDIQGWTSHFVCATHDSKIVYRSAAVLGYGDDFRYQEVFGSKKGQFVTLIPALLTSMVLSLFSFLVYLPPTRSLLKCVLPGQGQGPSKETRDSGYFWVDFIAKAGSGADSLVVKGVVGSDKGDSGYKETAKMLGECGLCLVMDEDKITYKAGGILTTAVAMGLPLLERFRKADMTFSVQ
ncbi:unnamed protein product [Choristocarpus tenellus]